MGEVHFGLFRVEHVSVLRRGEFLLQAPVHFIFVPLYVFKSELLFFMIFYGIK
jgi:hypothetical protein